MNPNPSVRHSIAGSALDASLLGDLWFFEAAARLHGFSAAARELHVTHGAVSQRIRRLEERLGARLFERFGRGVGLTSDGERLFTVVSSAFQSIKAEAAGLTRRQRSNEIVISCTPSLSMEWLLPRLSSWYRISDNAKVQIRAEFHRVNSEIMVDENIDIAIRYDLAEYSDLEVFELHAERLFPVCTRSYWQANDCFAHPQDLQRLTLLHDGSPWIGAEPSTEWRAWLAETGVTTIEETSSEYFNLAQMAVRAALLDQGIAIGRSILVADHLKDRRLIRPFGSASIPGAKYRLMTREPIHTDDVSARLAQWMKIQMERSARDIRDLPLV